MLLAKACIFKGRTMNFSLAENTKRSITYVSALLMGVLSLLCMRDHDQELNASLTPNRKLT